MNTQISTPQESARPAAFPARIDITPLRRFKFSDIYLASESAAFKGTEAGQDSLVPPPAELEFMMAPLLAECRAAEARTASIDFAIDFHGMRFRVARMDTIEGSYFVLRRFPERVPKLLHLGLPGWVMKLLLVEELPGLITVVGATGSGKTTTASALVKHLLERFGGVAVTIEDPPEMPLQGIHGKGTCFQVEVENNDYAARCHSMLRWHPDIIFLGEIRDPETAGEALRASINGHRVVCTVHASSVQAGMERLHALAAAVTGSDDAANLLANGLAAVLFQKLVWDGPKPHIETEFLFLKGPDGAPARAHVSQRNFKMIPAEVESQRRRLDALR